MTSDSPFGTKWSKYALLNERYRGHVFLVSNVLAYLGKAASIIWNSHEPSKRKPGRLASSNKVRIATRFYAN
jgi:hypothetical protein